MKTLLPGSTVLVTGGAGLIGSHIVDQLIDEGVAEIRVLDNLVRGSQRNLDGARSRFPITDTINTASPSTASNAISFQVVSCRAWERWPVRSAVRQTFAFFTQRTLPLIMPRHSRTGDATSGETLKP